MPIKVQHWGGGNTWGDGALWGQIYTTTPCLVVLEAVPLRVAVNVQCSGSDFSIDRLTLAAHVAPAQEALYESTQEVTGQRLAMAVMCSGSDFRLYRGSLVVNLLPQQEHRFQAGVEQTAQHVALSIACSGSDFRIYDMRTIGKVMRKQNTA